MNTPRIHLAVDNCFAGKRWTEPLEWARVIRPIGLEYVEASADNECDPLYSDPGYLEDWISAVQTASRQTGVRVANLYSGHGTYTVLGFGSSDSRNRERILNQWLKVMVRLSSLLGAGLGFFCHAFDELVLQNPEEYANAVESLYNQLAELAGFARESGLRTISIEQMYSPHLVPWTRAGTRDLLRTVYSRSAHPFYVTLDTGHQIGQGRFLRPDRSVIRRALHEFRATGRLARGFWLGPASAYTILREAAGIPASQEDASLDRLEDEMDRYPYLFADPDDGDLYRWLQELACYSPIIHLQQSDGTASAHRPFTDENNAAGIVEPGKVLRAISASYAPPLEHGMPPRCEDIYLTIEIFAGPAELPVDILDGITQSVQYWRKYVPEDGRPLQELLKDSPDVAPTPQETANTPRLRPKSY